METTNLRTAKDQLSALVDKVEATHERVTITRNGHAAAVLISPDDLESLEETLDILSDPEAMSEIREARAELDRGEGIEMTPEQLRALLTKRRQRAAG
jgi:antitoxin YefM